MSKGKFLAVCCVWLVILGMGAVTWKIFIAPAVEQAEKQEKEEQRNQKLQMTGAKSRYDHHLTLALDSFSGYAVFRSEEFGNELSGKKIKLELMDDGADYSKRIRALESGQAQLALFTVDALIRSSAELGQLPGTIVALVDETRGADAMVAYEKAIPNIDALNDARTKFVLTPDSPSETLSRVVAAHFQLDKLEDDAFVEATDAEDVYRRYRTAKPDTHQVFVLWEPYVSKVLENPNTHVVVDSSRFRGYIVDVLVANRDFLLKNQDVVADVVQAYLRALHEHRDGMVELVIEDAKAQGTPLSQQQAENLVKGVWWKNTQENYAHLGLLQGKPLQHIEDMIGNLTEVLVGTGEIADDPTGGKPHLLYYDRILSGLQQESFHPGLEIEEIRDDKIQLPELSETQWGKLVPVGTMEVPPLVFARGTATLSQQSRMMLDELVQKLQTWPQYYVLVRGNASLRGDPKANKALALSRAKAAEEYLIQSGINQNRVRAVGGTPSGTTSVTFVLGQPPY